MYAVEVKVLEIGNTQVKYLVTLHHCAHWACPHDQLRMEDIILTIRLGQL